jgi:cell division protein FtsW
MFILLLYFLLCLFFFKRLPYIRDPYSRMIGVGIISLIIIQMFITIGVNVRILPNTWLTLPFISYGWTAIMVNMIQIVLLYKIVRER